MSKVQNVLWTYDTANSSILRDKQMLGAYCFTNTSSSSVFIFSGPSSKWNSMFWFLLFLMIPVPPNVGHQSSRKPTHQLSVSIFSCPGPSPSQSKWTSTESCRTAIMKETNSTSFYFYVLVIQARHLSSKWTRVTANSYVLVSTVPNDTSLARHRKSVVKETNSPNFRFCF